MKTIAEAPGKVIISGEHFVVHGGTALAAAIDRATRAEASPYDGLIIDTGLERNRHAMQHSGPLPVERLIREMYRERSTRPRVRLRIRSQLPAGAGLGSSAATMIASVAAVGGLEGWDLDLPAVIEAAMSGERMIHGKPSGIDAAASAIGGVLKFRLGEEPIPVELPRPTTLLLAYSGKRRSSGKLIHKVSSMTNVYPHLFRRLCDSATLITTQVTDALVSGRLDELGELMTYNHAVLGMVGASTPMLDALVDLCLSCGCYGAKLTGAGGGGSVLAIPPRGEEEATIARLAKEGVSAFLTEIPSGGVRVWTNGER
jgi:mevalonate kinase